jgi:ketosteroid isomerase-like protein
MASPRDDLEHPLFSADRPEPLLEWHRALRFSHPPNMGIGLGGSRMTTKGSRTAQEVFQDHARAIAAGDLDGIVGDYSEDAMFITHAGVLHGKDGVREGFTRLFGDLPDPKFDVHTRILEGDVLFLEWTAEARGARGEQGVETFLVRQGEIVLQTVHYVVAPESRAQDQ